MRGYVDSVSAQIEICGVGWPYVTPPSWKSRGYHANLDEISGSCMPSYTPKIPATVHYIDITGGVYGFLDEITSCPTSKW